MQKNLTWIAAFVLFGCLQVSGQSPEVKAQIERTVLNYAEGWYEGNGDKMESALHPDLAKRSIQNDEKGRSRIQELSALGLVQVTRPGYGKSTPKEVQQKDISILDVFNDIATVKLEMRDWVDYMHVGKFNGKWLIINVLWDPKPKNDGEIK